jgi:3-phosphoshikimate 1-carboxyvinyltransferase
MHQFTRPAALSGSLQVPGDKSISHRSLLFSALASGPTRVHGLSDGHDVAATRAALQALGIAIEPIESGWLIRGRPLAEWRAGPLSLDCGNSGTTMRLLLGVLAAAPGVTATLMGDPSLSRRPMLRVVEPLRRMGAAIEANPQGGAPLSVQGQHLRGGDHALKVASAQVKSAILLAGIHASGATEVSEPALSRDHTERMLAAMGVQVERDGLSVRVWPGNLQPLGDFLVPGDPSSAAFGGVAAVLHPCAELRLPQVCLNPTRAGWVEVLQRMGGDVRVVSDQQLGGERVAELVARSSALHAADIAAEQVPSLIDELPILAVAASAAEGTSRWQGIEELRVKESDRWAAIVRLLTALGVETRSGADWLEIDGLGSPQAWQALQGPWQPGLDHRMAMSAAVAGLCGPHPVSVAGFDTVASSWPGFVQQFKVLAQG